MRVGKHSRAPFNKLTLLQARWDVEQLHRHPDFVTRKKEPVQPKPIPEDDDLPPRPSDIGKTSSAETAVDGDGEFGSMRS